MIAKFFGVLDGSVSFWITNATFFGIKRNVSFELGDFSTQVFHHDSGVDRVDVNRNIEHFIDINERAEPASAESTRITININSATIFGAETEMIGLNFNRRWRN